MYVRIDKKDHISFKELSNFVSKAIVDSHKKMLDDLNTRFGSKIPIKFGSAFQNIDGYISVNSIKKTRLGGKIYKRRPIISEDGIYFAKSKGNFNYYTSRFDEGCKKLFEYILQNEALKSIAFSDFDIFIEKDFADTYLHTRMLDCPFNRQDLEIALIKEYLFYLENEYKKACINDKSQNLVDIATKYVDKEICDDNNPFSVSVNRKSYGVPIKIDLANLEFKDYISIDSIQNSKLGEKIFKRKPRVDKNGIHFFRSSGRFNYYTQNFGEACNKLSSCVLSDETLKEIAFRNLDVYIKRDFAEAYLNKRASECPFNRQDLEMTLIKGFLAYLKSEYEKIVFEPISAEKKEIQDVEEKIEYRKNEIKNAVDKIQNSDFFYKKVSAILD